MATHETRHLAVAIDKPYAETYEFLADPANMPKWATGLGDSFRPLAENRWLVETPEGDMEVTFTPPNAFGVLDHTLLPPYGGAPMHNPMRAIANGEGTEVVFTLFRRPGMDDAAFERDGQWILRDLAVLKALLEG